MKEIKDFETWYKKINKTNDEDEYLEFVWELMETPFTEYHYSLITSKSTNDEFKDALWSRFYEHEDAETFLLNKLENNEDTEFIGKILFSLGEIVDLWHGKQKEKVYEYAKKYAASLNDTVRENAIIVLGWLGGAGDIKLLGELLLNDKHNKCRAWAASAFMQIWFRRKSKTFVDKVLPYLYKSIKAEQDVFVIGSIIGALQKITNKKFGLTQKAQDLNEAGQINPAKDKAIKYFKKLYKESI
jgi:hypothetical protein